jgi:four helix bundle protein
MPFLFEKLIAYQRALDFADAICALTDGVPGRFHFLRDQLNRAALSVPANIAEGNGRFTPRDRRNFFIIARGSAHECVALLELASRRGLVDEERRDRLGADLETISRMLSGLIKRESRE